MNTNMNTNVTVVADKNGNVITITDKNSEIGYVRVVQEAAVFGPNSWMDIKQFSALILAPVDKLLKMNFQPGQELPGKIVIKESHQPFSDKDGDRDLKYAGDTGVLCRVDDEPIYRRSFYTEDKNETHEFIQHNNTYEIREVIRERTQDMETVLNKPHMYKETRL